jgi:hypothetical protein
MHLQARSRLTALNTSCAAHYQLDQVESIEMIRWCADLPHLSPGKDLATTEAGASAAHCSATSVAYLRALGQRQGCVLLQS